MLVCPKCHTKYAGSLEFCEKDGVKLEPESGPEPPKTDSVKTGAPPKDESAPEAVNVDELHAQIDVGAAAGVDGPTRSPSSNL